MKILITGANGQVGSELREQLKDSEHTLFASDLDTVDITDDSRLESFVSARNPDVIVNCASMTNVNLCENEPERAYVVDVTGAETVARAANRAGAGWVQFSSDYVFDGTSHVPYRETDATNPLNVYGKTKVACEELIRQSCERHFIIRTAWLYGFTGSNFVRTILGAARRGQPIRVVKDQTGNPTNTADLVKLLPKLIDTGRFGTYHCTCDGECSWYDFAAEFLRLSGYDCTITACATHEFPLPARRPAYSSLDNGKLQQTVGGAMRDWREAIADFMGRYDRETGMFVRN
jgi:dTDP-4-dehydrorhamnose reductase